MPNDIIANEAHYKKLARKVAEGSIVTDALARLIEQIIAEVHDSRIEPQAARIAELEAEVARLREALANAVGCFDAAEAEGLIERVDEADDDEPGSLAGLIRRRLSFAKGYAIAALAAPDTGGAADGE